MATRIAVGLSAIAVVLVISWFGGIPFLLLGTAAALLGGYEFYWMAGVGGFNPRTVVGLVWTATLGISAWFPEVLPLDTLLIAGFLVTLTLSLWQADKPMQQFFATAAIAVYLGLMLGQTISLRLLENGFWWLVLSFLIAWGSDSFAYFAGVTLGRHHIWPRLSPKKTWEGTIAGLLGGALVSVLLVWLSPLDINLWLAFVVGLFGALLGFFGDLSVSMVKRQVGVKDSGHLFPGHGGMLDRIDSLLFVAPFVHQVARFLS